MIERKPGTADPQQAKKYQKIKSRLTLFHLLFTPLLLAWWAIFGLGIDVRVLLEPYQFYPAVEMAVFFTIFSVFFFAIDLPFSFYSGFILEHRFGLSNLNQIKWLGETLKRAALSFLFSLLLIEGLYFLIRFRPETWWLWAWIAYACVSSIIGKLFPVFIVPLFYKYQPLPEGELKSRILALLTRYDLPAANLFSINLSKTTKKANAAFMGLGKTKRVVLSDTLIDQFSPAEIEQVVAHELGHFKHQDIWKQLVLGLIISLVCFISGFYMMKSLAPALGFESIADTAGLPLLLFIFLMVNYLSMPIVNGFSRICEFAADRFALEACRDREVFMAMMKKLGEVNLADPDPAPWYEWLFYSHPSITKRIRVAQKWSVT